MKADVLVGEPRMAPSAKELDRLLADLKKQKRNVVRRLEEKNIYCALWIMKGVRAKENVFYGG